MVSIEKADVMTGEQHDDHCTVLASGDWWRIRKVQGLSLVLSCDCGCKVARFAFPPDFDFAAYCDTASMMLAGVAAREERGALPVATGSGAWN